MPLRAVSPVVPAPVTQPPLPTVTAASQRVSRTEQEPRAEPVVRVTIGRVDVRLVAEAPAKAPTREVSRRAPALSLDEYLGSRDGRQR